MDEQAMRLSADFLAEEWAELHCYVCDDALVLEQQMTGTVVGSMLGLAGNGSRISFRMPHVFEFRDGLISRENVWLDTAAVLDQLG
ncbi:ester cyclase [Mycobacterium sp. Y57]|uniref:ester cyclase n=1 Tax=Mycolicibacterium xanthum TaxID=2796469 RepID=UPI001C84CB6B|nr:ester cyclase [Mycolicibacterium xanthum]MBX7434805.1 ester cyclase [Mycolicibacterium xanthum]